VLVGEGGARRLGAWVRFVLQAEGGTVRDAQVQVYGCPHTVAASRHVRAQLPGRSLLDLKPGNPEKWREAVNAPVEKLGRMLIIEDALGALRPVPDHR
jgi:NifU-like protein involved in Fe-S cluster formation